MYSLYASPFAFRPKTPTAFLEPIIPPLECYLDESDDEPGYRNKHDDDTVEDTSQTYLGGGFRAINRGSTRRGAEWQIYDREWKFVGALSIKIEEGDLPAVFHAMEVPGFSINPVAFDRLSLADGFLAIAEHERGKQQGSDLVPDTASPLVWRIYKWDSYDRPDKDCLVVTMPIEILVCDLAMMFHWYQRGINVGHGHGRAARDRELTGMISELRKLGIGVKIGKAAVLTTDAE
jgi:hypothetical protein